MPAKESESATRPGRQDLLKPRVQELCRDGNLADVWSQSRRLQTSNSWVAVEDFKFLDTGIHVMAIFLSFSTATQTVGEQFVKVGNIWESKCRSVARCLHVETLANELSKKRGS